MAVADNGSRDLLNVSRNVKQDFGKTLQWTAGHKRGLNKNKIWSGSGRKPSVRKRAGAGGDNPMPFKSQAQRRKFYAMASRGDISKSKVKEWEKHTPKGKKLPKRVKSALLMNVKMAVGRKEDQDVSIAKGPVSPVINVTKPNPRVFKYDNKLRTDYVGSPEKVAFVRGFTSGLGSMTKEARILTLKSGFDSIPSAREELFHELAKASAEYVLDVERKHPGFIKAATDGLEMVPGAGKLPTPQKLPTSAHQQLGGIMAARTAQKPFPGEAQTAAWSQTMGQPTTGPTAAPPAAKPTFLQQAFGFISKNPWILPLAGGVLGGGLGGGRGMLGGAMLGGLGYAGVKYWPQIKKFLGGMMGGGAKPAPSGTTLAPGAAAGATTTPAQTQTGAQPVDMKTLIAPLPPADQQTIMKVFGGLPPALQQAAASGRDLTIGEKGQILGYATQAGVSPSEVSRISEQLKSLRRGS